MGKNKENDKGIKKARLGNMLINEVSLVDKAANKRNFLFYKRDTGGDMSDKEKAMEKALQTLASNIKALANICKENEAVLSKDQKASLFEGMSALPFEKEDDKKDDDKKDDKSDDKKDDADKKTDDKKDDKKGDDDKKSDDDKKDDKSDDDKKSDDKDDSKAKDKDDEEELEAMRAVAAGLETLANDVDNDDKK